MLIFKLPLYGDGDGDGDDDDDAYFLYNITKNTNISNQIKEIRILLRLANMWCAGGHNAPLLQSKGGYYRKGQELQNEIKSGNRKKTHLDIFR